MFRFKLPGCLLYDEIILRKVKNMNSLIPIIIPAYEPDMRLIRLLEELSIRKNLIIIVNDGSGQEYEPIFERAKAILREDGIILTHKTNRGKGRALKTAFSYILERFPNAIGAVTADSDGQHNMKAIESVEKALMSNQMSLVLGIRDFNDIGIPWKSKFGNKLTMKVLSYVAGIRINDTQTGLRGIPRSFMEHLLDVPGDRFEFETSMLIESVGYYSIIEVPIETIYDSKENHKTHFRPVTDSLKIYCILGKRFLKYVFSSLSSSILDIVLFTLFCYVFKKENNNLYVVFSTIMARIFSAIYNYFINYKIVFRSQQKVRKTALKYCLLAIMQMGLSAILVTLGVHVINVVPEVFIKIPIDFLIFFASYYIQQNYIFLI